jgi:preprotein translocase subunit SecF
MITKPRLWLYVSSGTMAACIVIMLLIKPVWGIDFTGGSLLEIPGTEAQIEPVKAVLTDMHLPVSIQTGQAGSLLIRTSPLDQATHQKLLDTLKDKGILKDQPLRFESIGPTIGQELRQKAWISTLLVVSMIVLYLAYEFRGAKYLTASWKFGVATAYALIHDLLVVTAIFFILGKWLEVPIDTLFVTALLAILGYSVHDTIIIFNRLRYEWGRARGGDVVQIMDRATKLTLTRSLNTSLTILISLLALLFVGGESIHWFILALTIGTIVGTYSSIFVATPFLYFLSRRWN